MTYVAKVHFEQGLTGGDKLVVESGGEIDIKTGGKVLANGTQAAHVTDASVAHALNSTFSDTEVEAALNALGVKINALLVVVEGAGLTATS